MPYEEAYGDGLRGARAAASPTRRALRELTGWTPRRTRRRRDRRRRSPTSGRRRRRPRLRSQMPPELSSALRVRASPLARRRWLVTPLAIRLAVAHRLPRPAGRLQGPRQPDAVPRRRGGHGRHPRRRPRCRRRASTSSPRSLGAARSLLCVVGTIDDRRNLSPVLAARGRDRARRSRCAPTGIGWACSAATPLDLLLTIVWVVGIVNAFNLMDNMDGAAAHGRGVSRARRRRARARRRRHRRSPRSCFALAGACAGFLPLQPRARRRGSSSATAAACRSAS